jgi:hypothetical protein
MKYITTIVAAFAVLLLTSCSKSGSQPVTESVTYPTDPAAVTSNSSFMLVYKSDRSGITYYARRLPSADISKMPEASVVKSGTNAVLCVPVKDGKVVDPDSGDRAELENKIPPGMLK